MDRRQLLGGMLSLAATPLVARASDSPQITAGIYDLGVPYLGLSTPRQNCPQWCWAASIETIFRAHGHPVKQEEIVSNVWGSGGGAKPPCLPATLPQMIKAIDRDYTDENGVVFKGQCVPAKQPGDNPANTTWWRVAKSELSQKRPLLAGYHRDLAGHAVVITHMRVYMAPGKRDRLISMTVRDPWPNTPNLRRMEPAELRELFFVAAVRTRKG